MFELGPRSDLVAKVYRRAVPREKQEKLRGMTALRNSYLKEIAAWPLETLHAAPGGGIVGFLMPKVTNHEPIHHLYGPTHRKQIFPQSDFSFLVHVSRNVAAAFDAIHQHGHVIGDVNQGNLVVGADGRVKLIDCDSFQIQAGGTTHLCEVGVPIFTAPELQSAKSFKGIVRTPNHDNFGLALLVFHLLQMGRHPFSGVFNQGKGDMPLEKAIAEFRFAYGGNRKSRLMDMPPSALPLEFLSADIAAMFERAFGETGATGNRPTAAEWVQRLDVFKQSLRACGAERIHKYAPHLSACPWCDLEKLEGVQFFLPFLQITTGSVPSRSGLDELWAQIRSMQPPPILVEYILPRHAVTGDPPPVDLQRTRRRYLVVASAVLVALISLFVVWPNLALLWIAFGIALKVKFRHPYAKVRRERKAYLGGLQKELDLKLGQYRALASVKPFTDLQGELNRVKADYDRLEPSYQAERQKLRENVQAQQLKKHLEGFFLSQAKISGIGPSRLTVLASFGVETAADIEEWRIRKIPGFGPKLTGELLSWRRSVQRRFRFNPLQGVDPREERQLMVRFNQKRVQLHGTLEEGFSRLQRLKAEILSRRSSLKAALDKTAVAVRKAQADVTAVGGW